MAEAEIGIIGGSGLYSMPGFTNVREVRVETPFGEPSDAFVLGELDKIGNLLDTSSDEIGLSLMNQRLPQRVRTKRVKPESGAQ